MGRVGLKAFVARTYKVSYRVHHRICSRHSIQTIDNGKFPEDE
jgi:hypothetical protein